MVLLEFFSDFDSETILKIGHYLIKLQHYTGSIAMAAQDCRAPAWSTVCSTVVCGAQPSGIASSTTITRHHSNILTSTSQVLTSPPHHLPSPPHCPPRCWRPCSTPSSPHTQPHHTVLSQCVILQGSDIPAPLSFSEVLTFLPNRLPSKVVVSPRHHSVCCLLLASHANALIPCKVSLQSCPVVTSYVMHPVIIDVSNSFIHICLMMKLPCSE